MNLCRAKSKFLSPVSFKICGNYSLSGEMQFGDGLASLTGITIRFKAV